jgi:hypothetical protein
MNPPFSISAEVSHSNSTPVLVALPVKEARVTGNETSPLPVGVTQALSGLSLVKLPPASTVIASAQMTAEPVTVMDAPESILISEAANTTLAASSPSAHIFINNFIVSP